MINVITLLIGALVLFVLLDGWVIFRKGKRRFKKGQPGLGDIISKHDFKLKIESSGRMSRFEISRALEDGGRPALDALIRKTYGDAKFHEYSIDYCYPHIDYNGKRQMGCWSRSSREDEATIFFYRYVDPPKPKPKPRPEPKPDPTRWSDADERQRIELFLAGPSAFWLNPDWSGGDNLADPGTEPFWMIDPATIPSQLLPVTDTIQRVAEEMAYLHTFDIAHLEHHQLASTDAAYIIYLPDDENYVTLTGSQYRQARRIARELMR